MEFSDTVTTLAELRGVIREPHPMIRDKHIDHLDDVCREFIAASPFVLIASCDADGNMDISPKGDPPGFVHVLDDHWLAIPDRPGNNRADTLRNVIENPAVGLIFLIPGTNHTLRVNGRATIVTDADVLAPMAVRNRPPKLALAVEVDEALLHCTKCVVRSKLWNGAESDAVPGLAEAIVQQARIDMPLADMQAALEDDEKNNLY